MTDSAAYFTATQSDGLPGQGTWINLDAGLASIEIAPGLFFNPIISGSMALNVVRFEPNTEAPVHSHEEEQISLVTEGELEFEVNGEVRVLGPNMAVVIPPHTPHGARTHDTSCVAVDVFHPPRKLLVEAMKARQTRG